MIRWQSRRRVRSSLILGALLAITAGALMLGLSLRGRSPKQRMVPVRAPASVFSSTITTIKGLSLTTQNDDRLLFKVDAEELTIQPKSFFVFNVKYFDEIFIKNGVIELYLRQEESKNTDLLSFFDTDIIPDPSKRQTLKDIALRLGMRIQSFTLHIYKDNALAFTVQAEETIVTFLGQKAIRMKNCILEDVLTHRSIMSKLIIWDAQQKTFKVPDDYLAVTPHGKATGRRIKVDINFIVTALRTESG